MTEMMKNIHKNPTHRDMLLKLSGLSQKYSILQELAYTTHFDQMLTHNTSLSINELNRCLSDEACDADDVPD